MSHATAINTFIDDLAAETWTPLTETLYNIYRYFQSRTNPTLGKNGTTPFPAYDIQVNGATTTDPSLVPVSPAKYTCQKSFVIIITDGEPTRDDFDGMDSTRFVNELVGDYNPDNTLPENGDETPSSCAYCNETTFYLDDLAKFMHENDFQGDLTGDQFIDIYTVGFTTAAPANALLSKTASVGNGLFFHSNNAEELTRAIVNQISEIIEKAQSFTSATVPASRTTDGANFYSSYFLPRDDTGFWEGHLKNFEFTNAGDIVAADGTCATGPAGSMPPGCPAGLLRTTAPAFWDAATELPAPASRTLYVGFSDTQFGTQPDIWSTIDKDDLDLVSGDASISPYDTIPGGDLDDIASAIIESFEGCDFGSSPCTPRTNDTGGTAVLGDIFHSNAIVVGSPNSAINEDTYGEFAIEKRNRSRVIYAGANDGFLHAFNSGDWQTLEADLITPRVPPAHDRGTGVELFGFMPYAVREVAKVLPTKLSFPRAFETVDAIFNRFRTIPLNERSSSCSLSVSVAPRCGSN